MRQIEIVEEKLANLTSCVDFTLKTLNSRSEEKKKRRGNASNSISYSENYGRRYNQNNKLQLWRFSAIRGFWELVRFVWKLERCNCKKSVPSYYPVPPVVWMWPPLSIRFFPDSKQCIVMQKEWEYLYCFPEKSYEHSKTKVPNHLG